MQQAISHWIGAGPQGATGHSLESVMHNRGKRACAFDLPRSALGLTRWRGFPEGSSLGLTSLMTPRSYHLVDCHRNDPRPKAIGASFASCDTAAKKWPMPLRRSCTVPVTAEPLPTRFGAVIVSAPRKKGGPHEWFPHDASSALLLHSRWSFLSDLLAWRWGGITHLSGTRMGARCLGQSRSCWTTVRTGAGNVCCACDL